MSFVEAPLVNNKFNKGKYNNGFDLVYIMKTEKTGLYIISKEIQNDLTTGRWGGVSCHNIILSSEEAAACRSGG